MEDEEIILKPIEKFVIMRNLSLVVTYHHHPEHLLLEVLLLKLISVILNFNANIMRNI